MSNPNLVEVFTISVDCYDNCSSPFHNSFSVANRGMATRAVMNEILNWVDGNFDDKNYGRIALRDLHVAWMDRNLDKILEAWEGMSSLEITVTSEVIDTSIVSPTFPDWPEDEEDSDSESEVEPVALSFSEEELEFLIEACNNLVDTYADNGNNLVEAEALYNKVRAAKRYQG